jgi:acyl carrier protein
MAELADSTCDEEEVVERVCDVIADVFGVARDELGAATAREDIPEWDSLGHLNLMLALEEAFNVSFSVDEMPELVSVKAIVQKVR